MFSRVFIAILEQLSQYPRVFIAISPLRIRGVTKSGLLVVLGGPDRAITMCFLQFHEYYCNIHVFIDFLPSFRCPSGAIGGLYRAITVCLLRSIYEKCDIIVCLLQLGLFLVASGAPFGIPWGSLVVLLGVFGLLWATFWQMRCTFNVLL